MTITTTRGDGISSRHAAFRTREVARGPCPECGGKNRCATYDDGHQFCHRCDKPFAAANSATVGRKAANSKTKQPIDFESTWKKARTVFQCWHPYLRRKGGLFGFGLKSLEGRLVAPLRDIDGRLHSLQFISSEGRKRLARGCPLGDSFFSIGKNPLDRIFICEGVADALTIYRILGCYTAAAISAGRLERIARVHRDRYPEAEIVIVGDNDEK